MAPSSLTLRPRRAQLVAFVALGIVGLTACSGSKGATGTTPPSLSPAPAPTASAGAAQRAPRPGVTGEIAAIEKTTLQVQDGNNGQTAVTYTSKTAFTQAGPAALADVTVGACVAVTRADSGSSATPSAGPSTTVAAGRVTISSPVDGVCAGGFGGGQASGRGTGRVRPSGAPASQNGAFGGFGGFGGFGANGQVTSVSATGFTVKNTLRPGAAASNSSADNAATAVTVSATTVLTKPKAATAAALKVGECVTALGASDSTGAVTATAITIRAADANGCGTRRPAQSAGATNG